MQNEPIRQALNDLLADIAEQIGNGQEEQIRDWLMAATLQIWAGNRLCSEDYGRALPVFHGVQYSTAQILTALDCAGEDGRELRIPPFFEELAIADAAKGTGFSREIADKLCWLLAELALVNGDFTMEEAAALGQISDLLQDFCSSLRIPLGPAPRYLSRKTTPMCKTGYYQPSADREEPEPPGRPEPPKLDAGIVSGGFDPEPVSDTPGQGADTLGVNVQKPEKQRETLESVLAELNSLVGLEKVKSDVRSLLNFLKICQLRGRRGMKVPTVSYHLVFTGNPGTGKTTVARLVARLYYMMGILPKGQLVETDRSGLVAGYLGQTAIKTQKVIQEALGGVLFIDEAYSLANDREDSYGKEAIETILKAMEDHRDELVVIVAGYDGLMQQFIDANPGLRSRFNKYFHFPDYTGEELVQILQRFCATNGYTLSPEALAPLREILGTMYDTREEHFGNARTVRNLFEQAINHQADRLVLEDSITDEELARLTLSDISAALEGM